MEKPGRKYPVLSWRQPCLSVCLSASQVPLSLPKGPGSLGSKGRRRLEKERSWSWEKLRCAGAGNWSPASAAQRGHHLLMEETLGTVSLSQMPSGQKPVPDLPGKHSWVLSLVFSNLVYNFGCCHFWLGAADHPGLMLPVPCSTCAGKGSRVSEKQAVAESEAAGSGAAKPLSRWRQWCGGEKT